MPCIKTYTGVRPSTVNKCHVRQLCHTPPSTREKGLAVCLIGPYLAQLSVLAGLIVLSCLSYPANCVHIFSFFRPESR